MNCEIRAKFGNSIWLLPFILSLSTTFVQGLCPHPDVRLNSRVSVTPDLLETDAQAEYTCDIGFVRIGNDTRVCQSDGTWSGEAPSCATNVAHGKPTNQSSTARGGAASNGNDGDLSTLHDGSRCTETLQQSSPWWSVDLLAVYQVELIQITTRGCCGQKPLQNIEIRVGSSSDRQSNRLCAWQPGTLSDGQTHQFRCAQSPAAGRYVFVQMVGDADSVLSLCEVQVFSSHEFAKQQCARDTPIDSLSLFNKRCYQIQVERGGNFSEARRYCRRRGGDLVHATSDQTHQFLLRQLQSLDSQLQTQLVWIGVRKQQQHWLWVDGSVVEQPRWGPDQPNSYVGEQNCVVADGGRDWQWNDVSCSLNYLYWICQYTPQVCGSPDKRVGTELLGANYTVASSVSYVCPEGSKVVDGNATRTCLNTGLWSGSAPACKFYDCGAPETVLHGETILVDNRTTFGARVEYTCHENYTAVGAASATCDEATWTAPAPQCLFSMCTAPEPPLNATVQVHGELGAGSEALFTCSAGHRLIGEPVLRCLLGGTWHAPSPLCQLVDCGPPPPLADGSAAFNATYYGAVARFQCGGDFVLRGDQQRVCQEDGLWSGQPTVCEPISCGEPEVPDFSSVTGYDFRVHSVIEYHCEPGHQLHGAANRTCLRDATWSHQPPYCQYVDCGRLVTIRHGKIRYLSGATHLDAQVQYTCVTNFQLIGAPVRTCLASGRWSHAAPECDEIRCDKPEVPQYAAISVSRNDQMRQKARQIMSNLPPVETYRVGATVTYSCQPGYKVEGTTLRTCRNNGGWSGLPPQCVYVDCGAPPTIGNATVTLATRATHYGAIAEYRCELGFRAEGVSRRICLGDGDWSGEPPTCVEVLCDEPRVEDQSALLTVVVHGVRVGDTVTYSCGLGRHLVGDSVHQCLASGQWNSTVPSCQWVDCGSVAELANGRVYYVNQSTLFDTTVEYNCVDGFVRRGPFTRRCRHDATWSGPDTECISVDEAIKADLEHEISGSSADGYGPVGTGETVQHSPLLWTGLAVAMFVVIALTAVVVCMRMRYQVVKSSDTGLTLKAHEERHVPIISFSTLDGRHRFTSHQLQSRPLPRRPGDNDDDDIYAEADSFSSEEADSGHQSITPPPPPPPAAAAAAAGAAAAEAITAEQMDDGSHTYANSSVTYSDSGNTTPAPAAAAAAAATTAAAAVLTDSDSCSAPSSTAPSCTSTETAASGDTNATLSTVTVNGVAL